VRIRLEHAYLEGGVLHARQSGVGASLWYATVVIWPNGARQRARRALESVGLVLVGADESVPHLEVKS
jgi:hypothetical protein